MTDEFSALNDALASVLDCENRLNTQYNEFDAKFDNKYSEIETQFNDKYTNVTNQFDSKYTEISNQFEEKYNGLEEEYATELTSVKSGLEETNAQLSEIKLLTTLQELINQSNLKSIDLSVGSKVTTTGYYEPNDKGEATYVVSDDASLVADSLFVFNLSNGKKLVRQYNDEVSAESIGFRESYRYNQIFDNTPILLKLVEYLNQSERQISLKFGHGWYGFSEGAEIYLNHKNGVKITGESGMGEMFMGKQGNGYSRGGFGTIFFAINENQEYILKFNGERTFDHKTLRHVNLSNIIFWCGTCSIVNSTFKIQRYGNGCKTPLKLHQVTFSKFKDLIFTGGHAVTDGIYWTGYECFFEDIMFRDIGKFGVLNSCINTYSTSEPYTIPSGSMFNKLSFENIAGSLLDLGQMTDVQFSNLSLEITNIEGCERTNFVTGSSYTDIPLIKFSDTHGAITFDNITVQHLSRFMYTIDSQSYAFRTIFYNSNDYGFGDGLVVSNVSLQGTPQNVWLLKYKSSNVNASTNPIYNFNGVQLKTLSQGDSADILFDVPTGVIVNCDGLSTNSVKSNKKHSTIFNKELTWKDTNLLSRITFDKDLQEHCLKPLSANYNSSIHGTPSVIFKVDTDLMIGTAKTVTGSLIMKKYPTATSAIEIKLIVGYNDDSSVMQTFNIDSQNARNYSINLELKPGIITHVRVEQTTEYNDGTLDFSYFYSMFMGLL